MPGDSTPPNLPKPPPTTHQATTAGGGQPAGGRQPPAPPPPVPPGLPRFPLDPGVPIPEPPPPGAAHLHRRRGRGAEPGSPRGWARPQPAAAPPGLRGCSAPVMAAEAAYRSQLRSVFPSVPLSRRGQAAAPSPAAAGRARLSPGRRREGRAPPVRSAAGEALPAPGQLRSPHAEAGALLPSSPVVPGGCCKAWCCPRSWVAGPRRGGSCCPHGGLPRSRDASEGGC